MASSLFKSVVSGMIWVVLGRIGERAFHFIFSIILARLLFPEDFGTIGIIMVFIGFANLFAEIGITTSLVQLTDLKEEHIHSAFWVTFTLSIILTIMVLISAPLLAQIYEIPLLLPLAQALSFVFFISAFSKVPYSLLQRRMEFNKYSIVVVARTAISGTVGISLAYLGAGIWSLVAQTILSQVISSIMLMYMAKWYPKFIFSVQAIKDIWSFSLNFFGSKALEYWSRQIDNLIIGFVFSTVALGLYTRAYALLLLPLAQIVGVTYQVMFPALSSIKDDKPRVKAIYLRAISVIAVVVCPMMLGIIVVADIFVPVIYGERWVGMIDLVKILSVVSIFQTFMTPTEWLFTSQGRADLMLRWRLVSVAAQVFGFIIGVQLGSVEALAFCYLLVTIGLFYPEIMIAGRLVNMHFSDVIKSIWIPVMGSILMVVIIMIVQASALNSIKIEAQLIITIAIGMIVYGAFLLIVKPSGWRELTIMVSHRLQKYK